MDFNIVEYGAFSGTDKLNTKAIQSAIDACAASGGGKVIVKDGIYKTGTLILRSNVNLHIEESGVLLGSPDCADYPQIQNVKHIESSKLPRCSNACLLFAEECENISITGMGKIDCNGLSFVQPKDDETYGWKYKRIDAPTPPRVVFFTGCKNVRVVDVTMVNQPSGWSYWIHDCEYVTFDRIKILADTEFPNNDGIHVNSSRDVTISNCSIVCGDDCIIVRANNASLSENKICERVAVTNCNLTSYACGIRIGWLNDGTIRNCVFSNIVMTNTNVGIGIRLPGHSAEDNWTDEGREATLIENLSFNNIIMDEIYCTPINCVIDPSPIVKCEAVRRIHFSNIHARGLEFPRLYGRAENRISDVTFNNCSFNKVQESKLKDYKLHGAYWGRPQNNKIFSYTRNIVLNGTSFTEE